MDCIGERRGSVGAGSWELGAGSWEVWRCGGVDVEVKSWKRRVGSEALEVKSWMIECLMDERGGKGGENGRGRRDGG